MKVKSARRRSIVGAKINGVIFAILLIFLAFFPSTILAIVTGVAAFTFVGEVINILHIKRRAHRNPEYLEEKIE